jgi:hypothetical protein
VPEAERVEFLIDTVADLIEQVAELRLQRAHRGSL